MTLISPRHLVHAVDYGCFVIVDKFMGTEIELDEATAGRLIYTLIHVFGVVAIGPDDIVIDEAGVER